MTGRREGEDKHCRENGLVWRVPRGRLRVRRMQRREKAVRVREATKKKKTTRRKPKTLGARHRRSSFRQWTAAGGKRSPGKYEKSYKKREKEKEEKRAPQTDE